VAAGILAVIYGVKLAAEVGEKLNTRMQIINELIEGTCKK
jgi:hypothetical protein